MTVPKSVDGTFTVRRGDIRDAGVLLDLFDESIRWMVDRGLTAQWGATPFSQIPARVEAIRTLASGGGLRICERADNPVGAMVLGKAKPFVPPPTEPELYIEMLIASHVSEARGAGACLLGNAEAEARDSGLGLLRIDCFAGNGGSLVRFYESRGFTKTVPFTVESWPGQVLERRLDR